jgi:ribosomal protein S18 acetylase RimI-like enzyme
MIRLATNDDAQRIGELWLEMVIYHQQFDAVMFRASENGAEYYQRSVLSRLPDPQTRVLVSEVDGKVVGYVLWMIVNITPEMFVPIRSGFLADICVTANYRRHGIGRELVERLVLWFQSQEIPYFEWHVSEKNQNAVRFWKSIGGETTMLRMRTNI